MPSTTTAEKAELRRRARQYLRELSPQVRRASDDALFARFLALPQVEAAEYTWESFQLAVPPER